MFKIDTPGSVSGRFADGQPYGATPESGTIVSADWLNAVQDELVAVLEAAGVDPDKANSAQLLAALYALYVKGLPPEQQGVLFSQARTWIEPSRTLERVYRAFGSFCVGAAGGLWPRDRYEEGTGGVAAGTARFTGTNGTLIPAGTKLADVVNGYFYDTNSDATISGGIADVACKALNVGSQANLGSGSHAFDVYTPIPNIAEAVDAQTAFTGGLDGSYYNCPGPQSMTGAVSTSHATALLESGFYDSGPFIRRGRMGPGAVMYIPVTGRLLQNDGSDRDVFFCIDPNGDVFHKTNGWGSGRALVLRGTIAAGAAATERPFRWDTWIVGLDTARQIVMSRFWAPSSSQISGHLWAAAASPIELHWGIHETVNLFNFTTPTSGSGYMTNYGHMQLGMRWAISGAYDDTARLEAQTIECWISRDGGELGGI